VTDHEKKAPPGLHSPLLGRIAHLGQRFLSE